MKNNSLKGLIIALAFCLFSVSVYLLFLKKEDVFLLDNPTDSSIKVVLNNKKYLLGPGQTAKVSIQLGNNTISAKREDSVVLLKDTFFSIENNTRGLINPTLSNYYTFKRYYGYVKNKDSLYNSHHIDIEGKEYKGEIKKYNDLVLQGFSININQEYPKLKKKSDSLTGITKLFRKNQFVEYYETISE